MRETIGCLSWIAVMLWWLGTVILAAVGNSVTMLVLWILLPPLAWLWHAFVFVIMLFGAPSPDWAEAYPFIMWISGIWLVLPVALFGLMAWAAAKGE